MGKGKLFKQDQEINIFPSMFALKRYSKAIFQCKRWKWRKNLHFCLPILVVYMQINNAQSCPNLSKTFNPNNKRLKTTKSLSNLTFPSSLMHRMSLASLKKKSELLRLNSDHMGVTRRSQHRNIPSC